MNGVAEALPYFARVPCGSTVSVEPLPMEGYIASASP